MDSSSRPGTSGNGFGIASLILGVLALMMLCAFFMGIICGVPAIIFAILQLRKRPASRWISVTGLVTGVLGILLTLFIISVLVGGVTITVEDMFDADSIYTVIDINSVI